MAGETSSTASNPWWGAATASTNSTEPKKNTYDFVTSGAADFSGVTGSELWQTWGGLWADPANRNATIALWDPEDGALIRVSYGDAQALLGVPGGLSNYEWEQYGITGGLQGLLDGWYQSQTSGPGGSYGGGATGTTYIKPDERVIREGVKGMLAALAGTVDTDKLDALTKLYMDEHRRSFDLRETEQLDPMESVKTEIRNTSEYKAIHALRPESTDEYDWISSRQGALKRAGVTDIVSEQLGIAQATAGASDQEATVAGSIATFSQSGQQLSELKNRIRNAAYGALQLA